MECLGLSWVAEARFDPCVSLHVTWGSGTKSHVVKPHVLFCLAWGWAKFVHPGLQGQARLCAHTHTHTRTHNNTPYCLHILVIVSNVLFTVKTPNGVSYY